METFGINQAKELLGLCMRIQDREKRNYELGREVYNIERDVQDARKEKNKYVVKVTLVSIALFVALIGAIVCLSLWGLGICVILFIASAVLAVVDIKKIIQLAEEASAYKGLLGTYIKETSPEATNERNARRAENLKEIKDCKDKLKYANNIYGQDTNYVMLYNESTQDLTVAGKMASEIMKTIDEGLANNILSAVQYIKQKEQTDAIVEAQKLNAKAQLATAEATLLAARQSAQAAYETQRKLDVIAHNTRD